MPAAFSLVVPAWNEEALLPALLDSVDAAITRYGGPVQVIIANNASTDRTAEIARTKRAIVVDVPQRGIACARNAGAALATGDILCFVDADSVIHPRTFIAIHEAMDSPGCGGGASGARVEEWTIPLWMLFAMTLPFRLMNMDTGVVFCRRGDFRAIGGYREDLRVGEDVDMLLRLRKHLRASGRGLQRPHGVEAITSSRKFDMNGHWRFMATIVRMPWYMLTSKEKFDREVSRNWYEGR
jgi:glycosyltransferase involved in cell wall biosynthesis